MQGQGPLRPAAADDCAPRGGPAQVALTSCCTGCPRPRPRPPATGRRRPPAAGFSGRGSPAAVAADRLLLRLQTAAGAEPHRQPPEAPAGRCSCCPPPPPQDSFASRWQLPVAAIAGRPRPPSAAGDAGRRPHWHSCQCCGPLPQRRTCRSAATAEMTKQRLLTELAKRIPELEA